MRELLFLHVGQAGVQMGNAVWELLCAEHGVTEYGRPCCSFQQDNNNNVLFKNTIEDKYVPRAVFVDLEPIVIDEIRVGSYRDLYHPKKLITSSEDAANNFARGFFNVGKPVTSQVKSEIRDLYESCDHPQALIIYRSLGGGTGAGFTSSLFESLNEYSKTIKIELPIIPSPKFVSSTVETYNCFLSEHFCMEDIEIELMADNESLFDIACQIFHHHNPTLQSINRIMSHIISNVTASTRFESMSISDIAVLQNNLVPYPRIHYPICTVSPVLTYKHDSFSTKDLTKILFERNYRLIKIDESIGKYMSCVLFYRGNVNVKEVYDSLVTIKKGKSLHFVDWCPTGFKVVINLTLPMLIGDRYMSPSDKNALMLTNNSSVGQVWQKMTQKFCMLFTKKAFVHWFIGEGLEECEFKESFYNIYSLLKDYEEVVIPTQSSVLPTPNVEKHKVNKSIPVHLNQSNNNLCSLINNDVMENSTDLFETTPGFVVKSECNKAYPNLQNPKSRIAKYPSGRVQVDHLRPTDIQPFQTPYKDLLLNSITFIDNFQNVHEDSEVDWGNRNNLNGVQETKINTDDRKNQPIDFLVLTCKENDPNLIIKPKEKVYKTIVKEAQLRKKEILITLKKHMLGLDKNNDNSNGIYKTH